MFSPSSGIRGLLKNVRGNIMKRNFKIATINLKEKLSSYYVKAKKEQFKPRRIPKLDESIYGGLHLVTLLTDASDESKKCAGYIEKIIVSTQAPITLEHVELAAEDGPASSAIMSIRRNRAAIKITLNHDVESKRLEFIIDKSLRAYASVVYLNSFPGYNCRFPDLNMMLIIKNVQEDFTDVEYQPIKGIVKTLRHSEDEETFRFICFAFHQAITEGRKKMTFVHNVAMLPLTDGHFMKIVQCVSVNFPDVEVEFRPLDYVVRKLISDPTEFDVVCSSGRYGTALTTISSAVAGGPNLFCSITRGDNHALFMPLHTKLSLTEYKIVSAYGILRCCVDLMHYLCLDKFAFNIWCQTFYSMLDDGLRTQEFGGVYTDAQVIDYVTKKLYANNEFPKDRELPFKSKF